MRVLTTVADERDARRLSGGLEAADIGNEVTEGRDGSWKVWLLAETDRPRALEIVTEFERDPSSPRFASIAPKRRREERESADPAKQASRYREIQMRERWRASSRGFGRLTAVLIAISVGIALLPYVERGADLVENLMMAPRARSLSSPTFGLDEIFAGQVWRVLTPIFVHGGLLHLIFNMMWLKEFGASIERVQSSWFLAAFVVVTGTVSNLAQYVWSGPNFAGMSGVVYALFGYTWIRGRLDPRSDYHVPAYVVRWMLVWIVLCLTPLIPQVANAAHGAGLGAGVLWGWIAARARRARAT